MDADNEDQVATTVQEPSSGDVTNPDEKKEHATADQDNMLDHEQESIIEEIEPLQEQPRGEDGISELENDDLIKPVQFAQLEHPSVEKSEVRTDRLNNVFVDITVELGRKEMSVRELTELKEQDVIDLEKLAGESFDVLINHRPFAEGEIVVVTDLMAVRITRIREYAASEDDVEERQ